MYQQIYENDSKPFVGLIIGPYGPQLNSANCNSELKVFQVFKNGHRKPYNIEFSLLPQKKISSRIIDQIVHIF